MQEQRGFEVARHSVGEAGSMFQKLVSPHTAEGAAVAAVEGGVCPLLPSLLLQRSWQIVGREGGGRPATLRVASIVAWPQPVNGHACGVGRLRRAQRGHRMCHSRVVTFRETGAELRHPDLIENQEIPIIVAGLLPALCRVEAIYFLGVLANVTATAGVLPPCVVSEATLLRASALLGADSRLLTAAAAVIDSRSNIISFITGGGSSMLR
mmetsp:Transcript_87732/g.183396  ORF Transcript_87732/g.183396 Transcript_87732/m.183396 type:complete len:210 (+) Transcript_87732:464-1093(+)